GLEYTQGLDTDGNVVGLTALNLDGYDLSGDSDVSEYDQIVVQILAKGDTFSNRNSVSVDIGLTSLSASGCGLKYISDVLDLTPIASADSLTQPFMLSTLDLSDNSISDVSLFISDDIFPADTLTTLDISGNYICDVDNVSSALTSSISTLSTLTINDQNSCACGFNSLSSSAIAFSEHRTCRRRSDGHYQVECWNGYYLDKETDTCVKACPTGYSIDSDGETCISDVSITEDNSVRCQVCERKEIFVSVLNEADSYVTCGCSFGFHGESCEYVNIPDPNIRSILCESVIPAQESNCNELTISDMETISSISVSNVSTFEGLQFAVNLIDISIAGVSSDSIAIGNDELSYLPLSLVTISFENVNLEADSVFSVFSSLETLSIVDNTAFTISSSDVFPSSLLSLDISGCTSITELSSVPTDLMSLSIEGLSISDISLLSDFTALEILNANSIGLTDWDLFSIAGLSLLTTLSLSGNSLTDISLLYQLSSL
ncbi:hypothetical protein ADUPG1_011689, partial [Aduncisulcus paluster]